MMVMASPAATTFVQTDTATFRDLVQKLTGLNNTLSNSTPPSSKLSAPRRSPFKLSERRRRVITMKKLQIKLAGLITTSHSPVTTVFFSGGDDYSSAADTPSPVEERCSAVDEKLGFYLQTSPAVTTSRGSEPPELLPLFPLTSPKDAR